MKWTRGGRSKNLEDRRAEGGPMGMGMPGGIRLPGRMGLGGLVLLVGVAWLLGINPLSLLSGMAGGGGQLEVPTGPSGVSAPGPLETSPGEEEQVDFVSFVLDDTQQTWSRLMQGYSDAQLVLFR